MAVLAHFLLNSDIESMKVVNRETLTVTVPPTTVTYNGDGVTTTSTLTVPEGVYVDIASVRCSLAPEVGTSGLWEYYYINEDSDDINNSRIGFFRVDIVRTSKTQYTVTTWESVQWPSENHNPVQFPEVKITVKLLRLVPTDQQ